MGSTRRYHFFKEKNVQFKASGVGGYFSEPLAPLAIDFISVAAAEAAAAADFIPRVAMSRRRDICACARVYTVPPRHGPWRA